MRNKLKTRAGYLVLPFLLVCHVAQAQFLNTSTYPLEEIVQQGVSQCKASSLSERLLCRAEFVESSSYRVHPDERCDVPKVAGHARRMAKIYGMEEKGEINVFQREVLIRLEEGCKPE